MIKRVLLLLAILLTALLIGCTGNVIEQEKYQEAVEKYDALCKEHQALQNRFQELDKKSADLVSKNKKLADEHNRLISQQNVLKVENEALRAQVTQLGEGFGNTLNEIQKSASVRDKLFEALNKQYSELMAKYTKEHATMERQAEAIRKVDKRECPELRKEITDDEWQKFIKVWGIWRRLYLEEK